MKCTIPDLQIMRLVLDLAIEEVIFWKMKLDGCSFQAPCASPRLRLMETIFYYCFSYPPLF